MVPRSHPHRWPWLLGVVLMLGSAIGASWLLGLGRATAQPSPNAVPAPGARRDG